MYAIMIVDLFDETLKEASRDIAIMANGNLHLGALFFKKEEWQTVTGVEETVLYEGGAHRLMTTTFDLMKKYDMVKYDTTLSSMCHWQFMNGVTDEMIKVIYRDKMTNAEIYDELKKES